ncbi:VWA domain-containing protein [Pseudonocardia benzenivorans]
MLRHPAHPPDAVAAHPQPGRGAARAADLVVDWEGGTRIGQAIDEFVRRGGAAGWRGGIVVVCSDGLDRGDPELLESAMLESACRSRAVWPTRTVVAGGRGVPRTVGMLVAEPYVDVLLSGRDLGSLDELAALLPELG